MDVRDVFLVEMKGDSAKVFIAEKPSEVFAALTSHLDTLWMLSHDDDPVTITISGGTVDPVTFTIRRWYISKEDLKRLPDFKPH